MGAPVIWTAAWLGSRLITPRLIAAGSGMASRQLSAEIAGAVSATLNNFIVRNVIGAEVQHALRHTMRAGELVIQGDTVTAKQEVELAVHINEAEVKADLSEASGFISGEAREESVEEAARRLADLIRERVPVRTGKLRGSVGYKKEPNTGRMLVGYGIRYRTRTAHLVELGTRPHVIAPSAKKALAAKGKGRMFGRIVHHPGQRGQHILRDVMAGEAYTVVDTYKMRLKQSIEGRYGA